MKEYRFLKTVACEGVFKAMFVDGDQYNKTDMENLHRVKKDSKEFANINFGTSAKFLSSDGIEKLLGKGVRSSFNKTNMTPETVANLNRAASALEAKEQVAKPKLETPKI